MSLRIGVDVGGTFTDFFVADAAGASSVHKTMTTPGDPAEGFFVGLGAVARDRGQTLEAFLPEVSVIVHGTTIGTNAVLTANGVKTGFITTQGFRDVLNLRRGLKERQWEFKEAPPTPLVPRHRIYTVAERIDRAGQELAPLDEAQLREAIGHLKRDGVQAVAVSFLWSFLNPAHEQRCREILDAELPGVYVCCSSEVVPQIRFYERNSTTALNAYVGPLLEEYLRRLTGRLTASGFRGSLLIMQSNGGVMSADTARRSAVHTLLSGPAAGPVAGTVYGSAGRKLSDLITIDMGGTSFDVALIRGGRPAVTTEGKLGGYRIATPIVDIHSIGAGGGSIAWVDTGGILRVGPRSAGASPGPACYGKGGEQPTVTDADLLLGYLNPDLFWGGALKLDAKRAEQAITEKVARPLGLTPLAAARGIYEVINATMADAVRVVSIQRGFDPRDFALVVAGGAGPLHAAMIAEQMEIPLVIVPRDSSVFCAAGMLLSDLQHDFVRSYRADVARADLGVLTRLYREMEEQATALLASEGITGARVELTSSADLRYVGQVNEVEVPWSRGASLEPENLKALAAAFHAKHDSLFGYSLPPASVEIMNVRLLARGRTDKPAMEMGPGGAADVAAARKGERRALMGDDMIPVPVYDGLRLGAGHHISGPAIVEQPTTTLVVTAGYDLRCDDQGTCILYPKGRDLEALIRAIGKES